MNRYRVTLTFQARSVEDAAEIVCSPERLPREARMRIQDVDHRRTLKQALLLACIVICWVMAGGKLLEAWKSLPDGNLTPGMHSAPANRNR